MERLGDITLMNDDCMNVLPELPTHSFDLAIVDPPYFSGPERRRFYGNAISTTGIQRRDYPVSAKWKVPDEGYFKELERVARYFIVWGCNYYNHLFPPGRIVWDKCNCKSSFSDCEIAATNLFDSVRLFPFMWNGMLQGKNIYEGRTMQGNKKKNEVRIHPTQKPVALYEWLLKTYAKKGWKILDTHLGSGSIAIACHDLGFSLVGIEIDKQYYDGARKRILDHQSIPTLF